MSRQEIIAALVGAREEWVRAESAFPREQAGVLRELAESLAAAQGDVQGLVQLVTERVSELYDDGVFINLVSEDGGSLLVAAGHHPDAAALGVLRELGALELTLDAGFFAHISDTGLPLRVPEITPEEVVRIRPELERYVNTVGIGSGLVVPLRSRGRVIGALNLLRAPGRPPIEDAEQAFLEELADRLAIGVDALRLAAALARLEPEPPGPAAGEELTERELEILDLLGRGHTNREAGERLHLSVRTVEWYRVRLQRKLDVSGRAALIQAARARGLSG